MKVSDKSTFKLSVVKKSRQFWEACFKDTSYNYKSLVDKDWSNLINRLKRYDVKSVLDLGCGCGHWSIVLAQVGFQVKAVDISETAIKILERWATEQDLTIDLEVCSGQRFKTATMFDAIICNSVLDHLTYKDAMIVLANIKNALDSKGIAYISFDGPDKNTKDFVLLNDGTRYYTKGKFKGMLWRYCTDKEIRELCEDFEIIEFKTRRNGKRDVWVIKN